MKAIVWTRYGPPEGLQLQEVEKPTPGEHELLIKVRATTVTAGDCEMRSLQFPLLLSLPLRIYAGLIRPTRKKIIGQEMAGEIESVGQTVTQFKPGDRVFGSTGIATGTYAQYICLPEKPGGMSGVLALKPANMTFEQAAAVPVGGLEALHFLRQANIQHGQTVLINGAGGSIGTFGVQLARYWGAEVTAVDSTSKLEMLRAIGAQHVIDYTQQDFTRNGETYDVIFDVVGKSSFSRCKNSLKRNGCYLLANPGMLQMIRGSRTAGKSGKRVISGVASHTTRDLVFLKDLVEDGKLKTIIDRSYPLEQMAAAHRYVETGRKKGNLVITVEHKV